MPSSNPSWWKKTTIYQIYPRSFVDSNGDGIGDLQGIIDKLDYIRELGFDTIWISPFFASPQQDFGYDVSDYFAIAPEYGGMADAKALIDAVHVRGMRLLFDLVLNHTSIEHRWFEESRSSPDNPRRDWYIWRRGTRKKPPNNWKAIPGGSGWHWDERTGEYYYASFLPFQPDLNWRNPAVKTAMFDTIRFWLDKGVDGFRLDIFHSIFKHPEFPDNPFSRHYIPKDDEYGFFQSFKYNLNQPEVFRLAGELRALVDEYSPERMLIGEVFGSIENQKRFLGEGSDGLHLTFLWGLLALKGNAVFLRKVLEKYEHDYPDPYFPVYVFGNHDRRRMISQVGEDLRIAQLLALMQFSVRGVPVTYYGEEIGMADGDFPAKRALDPVGQRYAGVPQFLLKRLGLYVNRDGCRTPMQWDAGENAGFCRAQTRPWLPTHPNRERVNVASQDQDDDSLLNLYRRLLRLRRSSPVLQCGSLDLIDFPGLPVEVLAYTRTLEGQTMLIAINFGESIVKFNNPTRCQHLALGVATGNTGPGEFIQLPPYAGVILDSP